MSQRPRPQPHDALTRAYYLTWALTALFGVNAVLAIVLGALGTVSRYDRLAFGVIAGAAALGLGVVGRCLHGALDERSRRH